MAIKIKGKTPTTPDQVDAHMEEGKPPVVSKNVEAFTSTEKLSGGVVMSTDSKDDYKLGQGGMIEPHRLAHVHVEGSLTSNLGNYESARFTAGITLPVDVAEVDDAYVFACDWVNERMEAMQQDLEANKGN